MRISSKAADWRSALFIHLAILFDLVAVDGVVKTFDPLFKVFK